MRRGTTWAAAALCIAWTGCGGKATGDSGGGSRAVAVHVQEVRTGTVSEELVYSVDLQPYTEVKVFSMLSETVLSFPHEDGDWIEQGERVALIRTKGLSANIAQIAAQAEGLDVQIAQAEDRLERSRKLLASGTISQTEFDQIESSYEGLLAQKKALKAGKLQVLDTKSKGNIRAPISGIIADKAVEVGDMAAPSMPLCRILAVERLEATIDLVEQDVQKVHEGQKVTLTLDAWPDRTFTGEITNILPYLDTVTRTNQVTVLVDNPVDETLGRRLLKPGMYGEARIVVDERQDVVVAPEYALLMDSELLAQQKSSPVPLRRAFVVDEQSVAHERIVELGIRQGDTWEVLDGLEAGERLVVRGQHGLVEGQKVEVVDRP
jgi:RND family efflux transporter MFP subunit